MTEMNASESIRTPSLCVLTLREMQSRHSQESISPPSFPISYRGLKGVVDSMGARFQGCEFVVSDARRTCFLDGSFDLMVDKGLFDSVTAGTQGRAAEAR